MKTAVETVFVGKERAFNRRFDEPPPDRADRVHAGGRLGEGTGREPGWRGARPVLRATPVIRELRGLNAWLATKCVDYAKSQPHPDVKEQSVFAMFEAERPFLMAYRGAFDGFHATAASVSKTCLVRFDRNKYSVMSKAVGRPVDVHARSRCP